MAKLPSSASGREDLLDVHAVITYQLKGVVLRVFWSYRPYVYLYKAREPCDSHLGTNGEEQLSVSRAFYK